MFLESPESSSFDFLNILQIFGKNLFIACVPFGPRNIQANPCTGLLYSWPHASMRIGWCYFEWALEVYPIDRHGIPCHTPNFLGGHVGCVQTLFNDSTCDLQLGLVSFRPIMLGGLSEFG